ncbi:MAG: hypothetical protein EBV19_11430 [Flavobacteriia bacterium]|nr:hypothetical protein [Flavobacteriia bacterium]
MLTKTRAIVIRKTPYTDNSAVLQLFTEQSGLLSFLVQGIHGKSASSKKSGSSSQSSANVHTTHQGNFVAIGLGTGLNSPARSSSLVRFGNSSVGIATRTTRTGFI